MSEKSNEAIRKMFRYRDRATRVLTRDGFFRAVALHNTNTVKVAEQRHNLGPVAAVMLGRMLSAATLLSSFLKSEERIILEMNGNGPLRKIYAEAMELGEVRGYVQEPAATLDWTKNGVQIGDSIGIGLLRVIKVLYGKTEPVEGIVEIQYGDISSDVASYLTLSEQIPSALILDVAINSKGKVESSAGLIVQALPGAAKEDIEKVQANMRDLTPLTVLSKNDYSAEDMLKMVLPGEFDVLSSTQVDFFCRCSKDRFLNALSTLDKAELIDMQKKGENELVCRYCSEKYYVEAQDFATLLEGK